MGNRNRYGFNKRAKDLKKRQKAADKWERKLAKRRGELNGDSVDPAGSGEPEDERPEGEAPPTGPAPIEGP